MRRRSLLRAGGGLVTGTAAGLSGCLGLLETRSARTPPLVEDRPAAVYFPSHVDGAESVGRTTTSTADDGTTYGVAVMYSYPHRFWTVTGTETSRQAVGDHDVHLMTVVWDAETRTVVPETGVDVEIARDGDLVSQEVVYPMLSQPMGFHYGGNFTLEGSGTYDVRVSVAGVTLRRTGAFEGRLGAPASATVSLDYSRQARDAIPYELTPDRAGTRAAVDPRETATPLSVAPPPAALPGRSIGVTRLGDVVFVLTLLDLPPAGVADDAQGGGESPYLAVSARTPYNGTVVPAMGLSASVAGTDHSLVRTLDPDLGYHYGTTVDGVASGDTVTVRVETPSQVARHEGYETAFLETGDATLTVE